MSNPSGYVVELQPGCWLAPWQGDPGRTLQLQSANIFTDPDAAKNGLRDARRYMPFRYAKIRPVCITQGEPIE